MTDPLQRLIDAERQRGEPDPRIAAERWERVVERVGGNLGPSVPVSLEGLPGSAASAGTAWTTKLVLLATVVGGGAAVAVLTSNEEPAAPLVAATAEPAASGNRVTSKLEAEPKSGVDPKAPVESVSEAEPEAEVALEPQTAVAVEVEAEPRVEPKTRATSKPTKPSPPASPSEERPEPTEPTGTLGEEAQLLRAAWKSLDAGALGSASMRLARHRRLYPNGQLAHERLAAQTVLRCRSGQTKAGKTFADAHPDSIYASRVAAACDAEKK